MYKLYWVILYSCNFLGHVVAVLEEKSSENDNSNSDQHQLMDPPYKLNKNAEEDC